MSRIAILEGPDGGGKTTFAQVLSKRLDARVVHLGPLTGVSDIGLVYVEAMLPALVGDSNIILDRSWISEPIYGEAFRDGLSRLNGTQRRVLDRLAMLCQAVVVLCDPGLEACLKSFRSRRGEEMLEREGQLIRVHGLYAEGFRRGDLTDLPMVGYDYTLSDAQTAATTIKERLT